MDIPNEEFPRNETWTIKLEYQRINKNIKISSFKSSENIQKKEGGPDRSVSNN